ncbi:hypothetical protein OIV83_001574 [Microbotryomycetes sp. JL201]|nr:hypothetical protein OIV83_001574 [Microbotryomycetes sp. JL201]
MHVSPWIRLAGLSSQATGTRACASAPASTSARAWVHAARALEKRRPDAQTGRTRQPRPSPARQHRQNGQDFDDSYFLASRVRLLASRGQLDDATELVKQSPPHSATIVVWNVLINEYLNQNKIKHAYDLWMDAKRRRQRPTSRSFATFLGGAARATSKQHAAAVPQSTVARVKTVHAQWLEHVARIELSRRHLPEAPAAALSRIDSDDQVEHDSDNDISALPTNHFLVFLGNAGLVDDMLATYSAIPAAGPTAATSATHSIVLSGLRQHMQTRPELFALAMEVWQRLEQGDVPLDNRTVSLMVSICREAKRPDDQRLGLRIADKYYGFVSSNLEHTLAARTAPRPLIKLDAAALSNVLSLAHKLQSFSLVIRLFNQVRDYPERFGSNVLTHHHGDLTLAALAGKRDSAGAQELLEWMTRQQSSVQPTESTCINAMQVFWRAADLARAYWLLSAMTNRAHGTQKTISSVARTFSKLQIDDRILATFVRTALATRDKGDMSRALDVLDNELGRGTMYYERVSREPGAKGGASGAYWQLKLAQATVQMIERVLLTSDEHFTQERVRYLDHWKRAAQVLTSSLDVPNTRVLNQKDTWPEEDMESRRRASGRLNRDGQSRDSDDGRLPSRDGVPTRSRWRTSPEPRARRQRDDLSHHSSNHERRAGLRR